MQCLPYVVFRRIQLLPPGLAPVQWNKSMKQRRKDLPGLTTLHAWFSKPLPTACPLTTALAQQCL